MQLKDKREPITEFIASLPAIQTAISIHGQGDGCMVKLDVPAEDMVAALKLGMIPGVRLRVVVYKAD